MKRLLPFISTLKAHQVSIIFLSYTFCLYFIVIFSHMLMYTSDGLQAGHVHVWGDWSLHIAMANIFAYKEPGEWFAYHPYYAGGKLTYGFLTNMISGVLIRVGLSLPAAFLIPSMIYSVFLVFGMYTVYYLLLKSQKAALTSVIIFFCSSGLGFLRFLADWSFKPSLEHLLYPTIDYTRIEPVYQWLAGNWINGMLVPQRAYLLGMSQTVWILAGVIWATRKLQTKHKHTRRAPYAILAICGLAAGILPIAHMHSFIVLIIASALLGLSSLRQWKALLFYAVPAGVVSTILYTIFIKGGIENPKFMQILIGWTALKHTSPLVSFQLWIKMWWEIWGVMMPVAIAGSVVAWKKLKRQDVAVLSTGFFVFILGNVILFQPIHWDNSKLFMWAYFFFAAFATLVLQRLWRKKTLNIRGFALLLAFLLTITGVMELWRLSRFEKNSLLMASNDDIELGEIIRKNTDSQAVFVTHPTHNHPSMMWGVRPVLMGYPAWAWNFGFLYQEREKDIQTIYIGGEQAETLLKHYNVSYISFGHAETSRGGNETYYKENFPLFIESKGHRIYDVRSLTGGP